MRFAQILMRLHFGQAADRALELIATFRARIEFRGLCGGRGNQFHAPVIKFVDQPRKASYLFGSSLKLASL